MSHMKELLDNLSSSAEIVGKLANKVAPPIRF